LSSKSTDFVSDTAICRSEPIDAVSVRSARVEDFARAAIPMSLVSGVNALSPRLYASQVL
jgi:hypothetical protein